MPHHTVEITPQVIPPIMLRGSHVVILLVDEQGRFVLGKKHMYPAGIARMVGGGIDEGENHLVAASREAHEELGVEFAPQDLHELGQVTALVTDPANPAHVIEFQSHVFWAKVNSADLIANDDLDGLAFLSRAEYEQLIARFYALPENINDEVGFAWADYGKLYGDVHKLALDWYDAVSSAGSVSD